MDAPHDRNRDMDMIERAARGLPKTSKEALALGLPRYFSGVPCVNGHLAERCAKTRCCPVCRKIYTDAHKLKNPESGPQYWAKYRMANREKRAAYFRKRMAEKREHCFAVADKSRRANLHKDAAKTARKKAAKLLATPAWADRHKIEEFYKKARQATLETGIPHEVDHILPLKGEAICGLHVHNNLQILTKSENSRKKNHLMIDAALNPPAQKEG